ncbi:MAG: YfhO family protein, partial [Dehalococcoidia bacterium]
DVRRRIQDHAFEPGVIATVENGPLLDGQGSGQNEDTHYGPNEVRFVVHTDAPALLVLSDVFYPGWQGYLDGDETTIYRTDAAFRGVLVPPGDHQVRMRFFPRSFQAGLVLAVLGLCLLA